MLGRSTEVHVEQQPHDQRPEETLVEAASRGEVRAFEELLDRYQSTVLRLLRVLGIPLNDREDVAQEVFVRVFRSLERFRPGHGFGGWIYRITVNASHDYRRRYRRRLPESAWTEAAEEQAAEGGPDASRRLEHRLRLERALGALSERERAVFVLCELEGLETRAVARALGITSITVRRHHGRARRHLQRLLREEF